MYANTRCRSFGITCGERHPTKALNARVAGVGRGRARGDRTRWEPGTGHRTRRAGLGPGRRAAVRFGRVQRAVLR